MLELHVGREITFLHFGHTTITTALGRQWLYTDTNVRVILSTKCTNVYLQPAVRLQGQNNVHTKALPSTCVSKVLFVATLKPLKCGHHRDNHCVSRIWRHPCLEVSGTFPVGASMCTCAVE